MSDTRSNAPLALSQAQGASDVRLIEHSIGAFFDTTKEPLGLAEPTTA